MSAPIPLDRWSWKWSHCKHCGTRSKQGRNKHKGNGLCFRCHDKERLKNPTRKQTVKDAGLRFFKKNRNKDWFREKNNEAVKKYLEKNKDNPEFIKHRREYKNKRYHEISKKDYWFRKGTMVSQRKYKEKKYFIEFINKNPKYLKKYPDGIKYRCDGCRKSCLITSPIKATELNNKLKTFERFKKIVIQECKEKPVK